MCTHNSSGTTVVWLTDGSAVSFKDTVKDFSAKPKSPLPFLQESYEGLLDTDVFIGYGCIPWQEGGLDTELEWALIFDQPLGTFPITEDTLCTLQGMIEGKYLSLLTGTGQIPWKPSSLGNNVIATIDPNRKELTGGVQIELGKLIENTKNNIPVARMSLSFPCINGMELPRRNISTAVLKDCPMLEYVTELANRSEELGLRNCRIINLGANGEDSGFVKKRFRIAQGLLGSITSGESWKSLLNKADLADQIRHWLVQEVIDKGEGMAPSSVATLEVFDGRNEPIGSALLETK